jgi:5-formyltetrahydrofolate cyclo-ligase
VTDDVPVITDNPSAGATAAERKAGWRSWLLAARLARPAAERAAAGRALAGHLVAELGRRGARQVAAYAPVGGEPGAAELLPALTAAGLRVLLPVTVPDGSLDWAAYAGELVPAGGGLVEPPGPRLGPRALGQVDAVLVPGLAVDRRGTRLGRGAGCYDRALGAVSLGAVSLGGPGRPPVAILLYDGELLDEELPAEPHDQPVSAAVTPLLGWVNLS